MRQKRAVTSLCEVLYLYFPRIASIKTKPAVFMCPKPSYPNSLLSHLSGYLSSKVECLFSQQSKPTTWAEINPNHRGEFSSIHQPTTNKAQTALESEGRNATTNQGCLISFSKEAQSSGTRLLCMRTAKLENICLHKCQVHSNHRVRKNRPVMPLWARPAWSSLVTVPSKLEWARRGPAPGWGKARWFTYLGLLCKPGELCPLSD